MDVVQSRPSPSTSCQRFNVHCNQCQSKIWSGDLTLEQLFTVLRTWDPIIQFNVDQIQEKFFLRNGSDCINAFDPVTGMNILMYTIRSGATGIGDDEKAKHAVSALFKKGVDVYCKSQLLGINCIHLAAHFDCPKVLRYIISQMDVGCLGEFLNELSDSGSSPIHLAAANLSSGAFRVLIECPEVNIRALDDQGRPVQACIGTNQPSIDSSDPRLRLIKMLLTKAAQKNLRSNTEPDQMKSIFTINQKSYDIAIDPSIGDRVHVTGKGAGVLKYVGEPNFSTGLWYGIELDECRGRNDGYVQGKKYFNCKQRHGIFVRRSKIEKIL
ncbi:hypothetical protein ACOME3_009905 [Neoechinorhynchus agilis]